MSLFLEQPLPIVAGGILAVAICLIGLLKSGRFAFFYLAAVAAAVTVLMLYVESRVVTPREEIEATLATISADLESNNVDRILSHVSSRQPLVRKSAELALRRVVIHHVAVKRNLEVSFSPDQPPKTAQASFNAVVIGSEKKGTIHNQTSPMFFVVDFEKEDDQWKVVRYERHPPQKGMQR